MPNLLDAEASWTSVSEQLWLERSRAAWAVLCVGFMQRIQLLSSCAPHLKIHLSESVLEVMIASINLRYRIYTIFLTSQDHGFGLAAFDIRAQGVGHVA